MRSEVFRGLGLLLVVSAGASLLGTASPVRAPAEMAGHSPARAADGPVYFQPGVSIDWSRHEVQVQARVVLRRGALEFLACWPGKEHESIVRCEARALHVYMALGLIGVTPGHPPLWDGETGGYAAPSGDLVDISFQWDEAGQPRRADAYDWLREVEYGRTPLPRPWVFAGSLRRADATLSSDASGVGVALVDFPDSLLCFSRRYPSRNEVLWAEAREEAIPSVGSAVRMVLRGAEPRRPRVRLDFRGAIWVNERFCSPADLADLLQLARQLEPAYVPVIELDGTLESDVRRVQRVFAQAGIPAGGVDFRCATPRAGAPGHGD